MDFDFEKPLQPLRDKIDALVAKSRRGDPTAEAALAGLRKQLAKESAGAYPGLEAEARGQGEAIGRSLLVMAGLKTPILSIVTGEGGSGGALAIAVGDRVLMMENAVYSVISPEGCAGILWRDGTKAPAAAEALKITAGDLLKLGAIDAVVKEPAGGAQKNHKAACTAVRKAVVAALKELTKLPVDALVEKRYAKLRAMGNFYA